MDTPKAAWKKRGYVSVAEVSLIAYLSDNEIIQLLDSDEAMERTGAAIILGHRKTLIAIVPLCNALKKEKALYSKIAISEALGNMGGAAANELILLFGKIGKNQHRTLPDKAFKKRSYPLPRDIAARTIAKIGDSALEQILNSIGTMGKEALSEAIDAIGFISFYGKNKSAYHTLFELLVLYKNDDLIVWKTIRALQSFPSGETETILADYVIQHTQAAIRLEAARSLEQICDKGPN